MANPIALGALSTEKRQPYVRPRVKQDRPAYGVGGRGFFDDKDKFRGPGEALYFDGEPNIDLYPLNKMAYDKMQAFLDKLDMLGEEKAKKEKKAYTKLERKLWTDDDMEEDFPAPDYVMGVPKGDSKQNDIR